MTVAELIEALKLMPPDAEVWVDGCLEEEEVRAVQLHPTGSYNVETQTTTPLPDRVFIL